MAKVFLFIFVVVVVIAGLWAYDHFIKSDFEVVKSSDWSEIKSPDKEYKLYVTQKDNIAVSTANIAKIRKVPSLSEQEEKESEINACRGEIKNKYGKTQVSEIILNNRPVVVCTFESKGENTDKMLSINQYYILNSPGKEYNYFITISYPKDDAAEADKASEFINGFKIH